MGWWVKSLCYVVIYCFWCFFYIYTIPLNLIIQSIWCLLFVYLASLWPYIFSTSPQYSRIELFEALIWRTLNDIRSYIFFHSFYIVSSYFCFSFYPQLQHHFYAIFLFLRHWFSKFLSTSLNCGLFDPPTRPTCSPYSHRQVLSEYVVNKILL